MTLFELLLLPIPIPFLQIYIHTSIQFQENVINYGMCCYSDIKLGYIFHYFISGCNYFDNHLIALQVIFQEFLSSQMCANAAFLGLNLL